MALYDLCSEIATLTTAAPAAGSEDIEYAAEVAAALRDDVAESLRLSWHEGDADPLLSSLESLRREQLRIEAAMQLLIAYALRFTHPRPYKLSAVAAASGKSISSVRRAYGPDDLAEVAELLGRSPDQAAAANA
jgi:hypothetical protein